MGSVDGATREMVKRTGAGAEVAPACSMQHAALTSWKNRTKRGIANERREKQRKGKERQGKKRESFFCSVIQPSVFFFFAWKFSGPDTFFFLFLASLTPLSHNVNAEDGFGCLRRVCSVVVFFSHRSGVGFASFFPFFLLCYYEIQGE